MWPNQPDPMDPYALQQQMGRGQQMQQMAMQPGGGGWGQVAMSLLGGIMGRRMEDRGAKGLQDYETRQREETIAKRQAFAAALTGGDVEGAIAQAFAIPGMENVGVNLLTERSKPKHVPDALWGKFTPESIAAFTQSNDPSVLKDATGGAPTKGLPTGYRWNAETGAAERIPGIDDYFSRQTTKSRAGTAPTIINMPGGGQAIAPTKPTQNAVQGDLIAAQRSLESLGVIGESFAGDYLTYGGKASAYGLGVADKLGINLSPNNKEFLAGRRQFQQQVEQAFNQYRVAITGAAASEKELQSLRQTFLNSDLGPTEFAASFQSLQGQMARDIDYYQTLLRSGIPVKEAQELFRSAPFGAQPDPTSVPSSDANIVGRQLQGELDSVRGTAPNAPQIAGIPRVMSDADFDALPRGATFIDPDGNQRVKP